MKKIKVLAKNHGYFNSVLPEKYAYGGWIDLKADNDRNGFGSSGVR